MTNGTATATQPSSSSPSSLFKRFWSFITCGILAGVTAIIFQSLDYSLPSAFSSLLERQHFFSSVGNSDWARLNNGTHTWEKTVILFSVDGLKPSYLTPELLPHLHRLTFTNDDNDTRNTRRTVYGPSMWPVSPSLTFPNHWSLMTGLEPSSHGIVANDFLDVKTNKTFYYTDPARSWDADWWKGVPLWEAVQRQGRRSANLMWPGPPITTRGASPDYFQKYESPRDWPVQRRVDQLLRWLDLPSDLRPSFICGYAPDIDSLTHSLGVNVSHPQILETLSKIDGLLPSLLSAIARRNASHLVDVILVSDHGMTSTSNDRLFYLDDILGPPLFSKIKSRHAWPNVELRFDTMEDENAARAQLLKARDEHDGKFLVLDRNELAAHFNWSIGAPGLHDRVGTLWLIPDVGYSFTTHEEMQSFPDGVYSPRGNHGYDSRSTEMQAFFLANGPSFQENEGKPMTASKVPTFPNTEIYNLVLDILNVDEELRPPNNGTPHFWDAHLHTDAIVF